MGIAGHILGPRKLRQLVAWSGITFDRAYNRNGVGEGRAMVDGECVHYDIDFRRKSIYLPPLMERGSHWSSCREEGRVKRG